MSALVIVAAGCLGDISRPYPRDDTLRLNQVQVLASHNSYHVQSDIPLPAPIKDSLEYTHAPLDHQLEHDGIRGFEIDVFDSPGGFEVFHIPVVDNRSNCTPLARCLGTVKRWSQAHPGHVPIFILIEAKNGALERALDPRLGSFDAPALNRLDRTVRSALGSQLITPDEVRGRSRTLREAVRKRGWPTLARTRGRIMVTLNADGNLRKQFLQGHESLQRRAMFVTADEDAPSAALIKVDDPNVRHIHRLVDENFIVRTRADADLVEARRRDTRRRDMALRSGAQIVSTDFERPDVPVGGEYLVRIPRGTPGRCDPVRAPRRCRSADVESPRYVR